MRKQQASAWLGGPVAWASEFMSVISLFEIRSNSPQCKWVSILGPSIKVRNYSSFDQNWNTFRWLGLHNYKEKCIITSILHVLEFTISLNAF